MHPTVLKITRRTCPLCGSSVERDQPPEDPDDTPVFVEEVEEDSRNEVSRNT